MINTIKNKSLSFAFLLALMLLFSIPFVSAANPGHSAASISSGTFESGNYTFPDSMFVTNYVGIGTNLPTMMLDVNGSVNVSGNKAKLYSPEICLSGSCITSWGGASLTESEVEAYIFDSDNTGSLTTTGSVTAATFDSGNGLTEIYDMDQDLKSSDNVNFGSITGSGKVTGSNLIDNGDDVILGTGAGSSSTSFQTAIGYYAGGANSGDYQTAIGADAGNGNSGDSQTAIGADAGNGNSGSSQTAIGFRAGNGNSGVSQTAIGFGAGFSNSGSSQTVLGYSAGDSNRGDNQIALGYFAGHLNSGDNITAVGYQASYLGAGNRTVALGFNVLNSNNNSDVIAIGYSPNAVASGQFILQDSAVNAVPLMQGNLTSGSLGINLSSPAGALDVGGSICISGDCISSWNGAGSQLTESEVEAYIFDSDNTLTGSWNVAASGTNDINFDSNTFVVDSSANGVGIGTDTPLKKLDVSNGTQSLTIDPSAANVTINTTGSSDLIITSSGGNVVIQLG